MANASCPNPVAFSVYGGRVGLHMEIHYQACTTHRLGGCTGLGRSFKMSILMIKGIIIMIVSIIVVKRVPM